MSLKERLKNSPWLTSWKYPIVYFVVSAVFVALFLTGKILETYKKMHLAYITLVLFTLLLYFVRIMGDMITANFAIKNHRQTPVFFAIIIGVVVFMLFLNRLFVKPYLEIGLIYLLTALLIIAVIFYVFRYLKIGVCEPLSQKKLAESIALLGVIILLLGVTQYIIVSLLLADYGGMPLIVLTTGVLLGGVHILLGLILWRKSPIKEASLTTLNARFEHYLDRVFKGLAPLEDLITLREQLSASLITYAEKHVALGISEDKLYSNAIDSLGDYSALIFPHKKNIFAKIASSTNRAANNVLTGVMQLGFTLFYTFSLPLEDWATGSNELFYELSPIIIFIFMGCVCALSALRVIENVRQRNHMLTPIFLGVAVVLPLLIIFLNLGLEVSNTFRILDIYGYIVFSLIILTIISQIAAIIIVKKKNLPNNQTKD